MDYNKINDSELLMMIMEDDDNAKNIIYDKYYYIVDIYVKKYNKMAYKLGMDLKDLRQEALVGFSDAINSYKDNNKASLKTFISICVNRRICKSLVKASRKKNQMLNKALSLEHTYPVFDSTLADIISDNNLNNPLDKLTKKERYDSIVSDILDSLSKSEKDVLSLMIDGFNYQQIASILGVSAKSIDNTINRIKTKVKDIIKINDINN